MNSMILACDAVCSYLSADWLPFKSIDYWQKFVKETCPVITFVFYLVPKIILEL